MSTSYGCPKPSNVGPSNLGLVDVGPSNVGPVDFQATTRPRRMMRLGWPRAAASSVGSVS